MFRFLPLAFALLACEAAPKEGEPGEGGDSADTAAPRGADADRDGWTAEQDCDDADPAVNPGATERCDGADQDCDGQIDEDVPSTWYADADADGYGDAAAGVEDCDPEAGYVADATDCDDADGAVHPDAEELCDGADQDCDGQIDEDAGEPGIWYTDADGDGYGDESTAVSTCDPAPGSVPVAGDCDDGAAGVNPDADELCDGVDQDCDGSTDENPSDPGTWYADYDGDGFGDASVETWDCAAPEGYVADATDCDDTEAAVNPDAEEICDGVDQDCDGEADEGAIDLILVYADADGDGYGDADGWSWACEAGAGTVTDATDCDDTDEGVNPTARETCDEVDQDCDGAVDEEATDRGTWYADADGDGYGDGDRSTLACDAPAGYGADATDCDDADDGVHPGATETCDDVDEDCDGAIDDGAIDPSTWYADADGDGFGDPDSSTRSCDAPRGYEADATDCDDADATVNPDAAEDCDGADQNCDDVVDDDADCPCDVEHYGYNAYLFCDTKRKWESASTKCDDVGYHLLTIDDDDENSWVVETTHTYASVSTMWWFGYNDRSREDSWVWEDGSSSTYTNWHSGEPNDSGGKEDCAQLNRFSDETWNDANCSSEYYYVCESY